jgi:E3 ubiquitin-protein ligase RNF34
VLVRILYNLEFHSFSHLNHLISEKEELVNLVLAHSRTTSPSSTTSSHRGSTTTSTNNIFDENCANPFITIRQTCTTFFSNISDRIAADLQKASAAAAAYEAQMQGPSAQPAPPPPRRSSRASTNNNSSSNNNNNNNMHRSNSTASSASSFASVNSRVPKPPPASPPNTASPSSSSAATSPRQQPPAPVHKPNIPDARLKNLLAANNGCECASDDEAAPGPSRAVAGTSQTNIPKSDSSTTSSFEELGASTGANSSAGGHRTANDSDSWQMVNNQSNSSNNSLDLNAPTSSSSQTSPGPSNVPAQPQAEQGQNAQSGAAAACDTNSKNSVKKINRRRSDSSVVLKNGSRANLNDSDDEGDEEGAEDGEDWTRKRRKCGANGGAASCEKCGKRKNGIKRSVARLRRQLEESGCSEAEKQRKMDEFLKELEERTKNSLDFSDSDAEEGDKGGQTGAGTVGGTSQAARVAVEEEDDMVYLTDENEGINVYGSEVEEPQPRRFLQLDDIKAR